MCLFILRLIDANQSRCSPWCALNCIKASAGAPFYLREFQCVCVRVRDTAPVRALILSCSRMAQCCWTADCGPAGTRADGQTGRHTDRAIGWRRRSHSRRQMTKCMARSWRRIGRPMAARALLATVHLTNYLPSQVESISAPHGRHKLLIWRLALLPALPFAPCL